MKLKIIAILLIALLSQSISRKSSKLSSKKDKDVENLTEEQKKKHFNDAKNIRENYKKTISSIAKTIENIDDLEEKARTAYEIRHNARLKARALMQKYLTLGLFKSTCLNIRDYFVYGNSDGPTFESLIDTFFKKNRDLNREKDMNAAYTKIIQSSQSTNNIVDSWFGVSKKKRSNECEIDAIVNCSSC